MCDVYSAGVFRRRRFPSCSRVQDAQHHFIKADQSSDHETETGDGSKIYTWRGRHHPSDGHLPFTHKSPTTSPLPNSCETHHVFEDSLTRHQTKRTFPPAANKPSPVFWGGGWTIPSQTVPDGPAWQSRKVQFHMLHPENPATALTSIQRAGKRLFLETRFHYSSAETEQSTILSAPCNLGCPRIDQVATAPPPCPSLTTQDRKKSFVFRGLGLPCARNAQ